ncbi:MAG: FAD-dependent oxidoreductase, partial [Planctomycetes bacterium]|nr:FAD-dependent oxidoreductase [Planctomycetota bacterium]
MDGKNIFSPVSDADVTRAILRSFAGELDEYVSSDVIVVGAGPSGLVCARELARHGLRVLLIERNNYLGGGFWIGGFLMNKLTVRAPGHKELAKLGVRLTE